jgi:membrane-associated phospholipid phosphatase
MLEGEHGPGLGWRRATPATWDGRLATAISAIGSPPVLTIAAVAYAGSGAWPWIVAYVTIGVLLPLGYLVWLVRQGRVTDLDIQLREQRAGPMLATAGCAALAWGLLWVGSAPLSLVVLAGGLCLEALLLLAITLRWKISVHCAAAAAAAVVIGSGLGTPWTLICVALVAWSRVRLRRHTVAQTIAGSALGLGVAYVVVSLVVWA